MAKRTNPSKAEGHPVMTDTPPRQGTSKQDRMDMKSMLRRTLTLSRALTVGNLQHKKIGEGKLAITKATRIRISITEGLILTHAVYKPTNKGVGLLTKSLIEFWFKSKGAKIGIRKIVTETLIDVMSANKPMLLTFFDTPNTLTTGHLKLIIRLIRELRKLYTEEVSKFNVMGIRNPQRLITHNSNKPQNTIYNYRCRPPIIMFLTFGRGFPFLRPPRRERPRGTARTREASENEKEEV